MALSNTDISVLYGRHAPGLLRFLMRRTMDAQIAVDLVGETFAVAFEQRGRFRGELDEQGQSWLFGIANNLLNGYFRRGQVEQRALRRLGVSATHVPDEQIERIEQLAGSARLRSEVAGAVTGLAPDQRDALRLRVVEELPYPEVAERLDVTEQVARARVSRALRKLRHLLEQPEPEPEEAIENV